VPPAMTSRVPEPNCVIGEENIMREALFANAYFGNGRLS
jgi:hypothetical protein